MMLDDFMIRATLAGIGVALAAAPLELQKTIVNTGYAKALAAYEEGVRVLESSLGGIGGCPFAPRATGNIATEDLVNALHRSGFETGVDLDAAIRASRWLGEQLGRDLPAYLPKAGPFPSS